MSIEKHVQIFKVLDKVYLILAMLSLGIIITIVYAVTMGNSLEHWTEYLFVNMVTLFVNLIFKNANQKSLRILKKGEG